jgi:hypothetical protein
MHPLVAYLKALPQIDPFHCEDTVAEVSPRLGSDTLLWPNLCVPKREALIALTLSELGQSALNCYRADVVPVSRHLLAGSLVQGTKP